MPCGRRRSTSTGRASGSSSRRGCSPARRTGSGATAATAPSRTSRAAAGLYRPDGKGMAAVFADLDGDGRQDLYVTNDTQPNELFRNLGGGRFRDEALEAGAAVNALGTPEGSMGVEIADLDGDGRLDLIYTNFRHEGTRTLLNLDGRTYQDASNSSRIGPPTRRFVGWGLVVGRLRRRRLARPVPGQRARLPERARRRLRPAAPDAPQHGCGRLRAGDGGLGPRPGRTPLGPRCRGRRPRRRRRPRPGDDHDGRPLARPDQRRPASSRHRDDPADRPAAQSRSDRGPGRGPCRQAQTS